MSSKYNNEEFIELVFGITFGIFAILIIGIVIASGDFSFLLTTSDGNPKSKLRGLPTILFVILGGLSLYYSIKKIASTTKKRNDS